MHEITGKSVASTVSTYSIFKSAHGVIEQLLIDNIDAGHPAVSYSAEILNLAVHASDVYIQRTTPDPRQTAVSTLDVVFSAPIQQTSFTRGDVTLVRNADGKNLIGSTVSISKISDTRYRINGLSTLTTAEGSYELLVKVSGINNAQGTAMIGVENDH